ncbi:Protein of unknown function DUF3328 [Penicillium samsonianum]|uniref:Protein of unknown function DUF3328 n=1 Tax=Penicillium samsonianum TaxID=1882272 RepID=UPI0025484267|nr:Protein of unknown function DUF3328 [Penicillium samsonianum]KAJ6128951.1 Protein of unknown function DUF3328 [Penicillium samsonianum]
MQLSSYSPLLEAVEYYEVDWANNFHQESIYRGSPTSELELAWDRLWRQHDINVPLNKLSSLNRSVDANWKQTPAQYGGGAEANVEVFHQLHCLNMIRQYTYLDSYEVPPEGFQKSPEMSRTHVDHCIETLRIHLMCAGDVTPVLVRLDDSKPLGAEADFSTHHKCRRFDKLTEWMEIHAIRTEEA